MNTYINFVTTHPIFSAIIQFAILGTFGDIISKWLQKRKVFFPYSFSVAIFKMVEWAILAVCIKYAFVGFKGFVSNLVEQNLLPELNLFTKAFTVSVSMNLMFGLFLVIFHRFLDNLIARENNWKNINKGMWSLIWFWIPAHTITFMLDKPFQIGLAAVWSVVLGVILGYYNRQTNHHS